MTELKILCVNRKVCPDIIEKLKSLGFNHVNEIDSPSFDIVAKFDKSMNRNYEKIVNKIDDLCGNYVQAIQIS